MIPLWAVPTVSTYSTQQHLHVSKAACAFDDAIANFHLTQGAAEARWDGRSSISHVIAPDILTVLAYDLDGDGHNACIHVFRGDTPNIEPGESLSNDVDIERNERKEARRRGPAWHEPEPCRFVVSRLVVKRRRLL